MSDILMRFDTPADAGAVRKALTTTQGIRSFWTSDAEVPEEVGKTLELGFPMAPMKFDLRLERSDDSGVAWQAQSFPPHWVGTEISWELSDAPDDGGTRVLMKHTGWRQEDEGELAFATFVWGLVLARLKEYVETGRAEPALG